MLTKASIESKLREYFKEQPIVRAFLFGSFSKNQQTSTSDVDLLVELDKKAKGDQREDSGVRVEQDVCPEDSRDRPARADHGDPRGGVGKGLGGGGAHATEEIEDDEPTGSH